MQRSTRFFSCLPLLSILIQVQTFSLLAHASQLFTKSTIPPGLNAACSNALLQDVSCSSAVMGLQPGRYFASTSLQRVCTSECDAGLARYAASVASSCTGQTWGGFGDEPMPLDTIPGVIRYQYNTTCLMDSGRYCNNVAAQAAAAADPERELFGASVVLYIN
jgi:hypothetical protein